MLAKIFEVVEIVDQAEEALFRTFQEFFLLSLANLHLGHATLSLLLLVEVYVNLLHLLGGRVELKRDNPGGPLC